MKVNPRTLPRKIWNFNAKSIFWLFLIMIEMLPKKNLQLLYEHSHFKSAFGINFWLQEMVKLKIRKYTYLCIISLTTSRSWKFIPKADLKWECLSVWNKYSNILIYFNIFRWIYSFVQIFINFFQGEYIWIFIRHLFMLTNIFGYSFVHYLW